MTNMKMNTVILLSLAACTGMLACPGAWATAVCQEQSYHLKTACPHPLSLAGPADERVYLRFQAGWASKYECEGLDLWDGSLCMFIPEIQYKEWVENMVRRFHGAPESCGAEIPAGLRQGTGQLDGHALV